MDFSGRTGFARVREESGRGWSQVPSITRLMCENSLNLSLQKTANLVPFLSKDSQTEAQRYGY